MLGSAVTKNRIRITSVCCTILLVSVIGCWSSCDFRSSGNFIDSTARVIDVCELDATEIIGDDSEVVVSGSIGGYHEVFLYSDKCLGNENLVKLELDYAAWKAVFEDYRRSEKKNVDIQGSIVVRGRFFRNADSLYTYPTARPTITQTANEPIRVNSLRNVVVISYEPPK